MSVALLLLLLAGCGRQETMLALDPGFYPAAVAYDASRDRYLIGSFHNAEVAVLSGAGKRVGILRAATPGDRVLYLSLDAERRRLWIGLTRSVEVIDLGRPFQPRRVYPLREPARYAGMAVAGEGRVYLLDRENRALIELDTRDGTLRRLASLPGAPASDRAAHCVMAGAVGETYRERGALLLMPGGETLLVASAGRLYTVDTRRGWIAEVTLRAPLTDVTQLFYRGARATRHEVIAVRGEAGRITHLRFDAAMRGLVAQESFRIASASPLIATYDGDRMRLVAGSLRHHPVYCGDGRPNTPIRLMEYAPAAAPERWAVADRSDIAGRGR